MQPKNGISKYTHFIFHVYMPEGQECCQLCPACKQDNDIETKRCKQTGEIIPYFKTDRGDRCPLELVDETEEDE